MSENDRKAHLKGASHGYESDEIEERPAKADLLENPTDRIVSKRNKLTPEWKACEICEGLKIEVSNWRQHERGRKHQKRTKAKEAKMDRKIPPPEEAKEGMLEGEMKAEVEMPPE